MKKLIILILISGIMIFGITTLKAQVTESQRLISDDLATEDYFSNGMEVSGNYAIIGSCYDDENGENSGSAYIFYNNEGTWEQYQKLIPSDGQTNEFFALTVAISGDYAFATSLGANDYAGKVYVFYNDDGTWTEIQTLTAIDTEAGDFFGYSIKSDGVFTVIGAYGDDEYGNNSGSVYLFVKNGGNSNTWVEINKIYAPDGAENNFFGISVDIDGDWIVIGADQSNNSSGVNSGSVYLYYRYMFDLIFSGKLEATDAVVGDHFGASVSISGDYLAIGANYKSDNGAWSGAAYIFYNLSGGWIQSQKILPSDSDTYKHFGNSVKLTGDTLIVGSEGNISFTPYDAGSAYIFKKGDNGVWDEKAKILASDLGVRDQYGYVVDFSNNFAFVASPRTDTDFTDGGAVYIFEVLFTNILTQPISQEIDLGEDVIFTVEAEGYNLTYQWRKDGGNIFGSTSNELNITAATNDDLGSYDCVVTGDYGTETSDPAILSEESGIYNNQNVLMNNYHLKNYPNPFNPSTQIMFTLAFDCNIKLQVYNINGILVNELIKNDFLSAGNHSINFDAKSLTSGIYYSVLNVNNIEVSRRKLMLLK